MTIKTNGSPNIVSLIFVSGGVCLLMGLATMALFYINASAALLVIARAFSVLTFMAPVAAALAAVQASDYQKKLVQIESVP